MRNKKQYREYKKGLIPTFTARDGERLPDTTVDYKLLAGEMEKLLDEIEENGLYEEHTRAITLKPGLELDIVVIVREVTE